MCSMGAGKIRAQRPQANSFTSASDLGRGAKSSATGGDDAVLESSVLNSPLRRLAFLGSPSDLFHQQVDRVIFHPPRNISLL